MPEEKDVSGIADQRADDHEIGEGAERKKADAAGVEALMLAHDKSTEGEEAAAAKHLLAGEEEGRRRAFGMPRINGADRPDERREKENQHAQASVAVFVRRRSQRGPEEYGHSHESAR